MMMQHCGEVRRFDTTADSDFLNINSWFFSFNGLVCEQAYDLGYDVRIIFCRFSSESSLRIKLFCVSNAVQLLGLCFIYLNINSLYISIKLGESTHP